LLSRLRSVEVHVHHSAQRPITIARRLIRQLGSIRAGPNPSRRAAVATAKTPDPVSCQLTGEHGNRRVNKEFASADSAQDRIPGNRPQCGRDGSATMTACAAAETQPQGRRRRGRRTEPLRRGSETRKSRGTFQGPISRSSPTLRWLGHLIDGASASEAGVVVLHEVVCIVPGSWFTSKQWTCEGASLEFVSASGGVR
jgi:hypothetical protein